MSLAFAVSELFASCADAPCEAALESAVDGEALVEAESEDGVGAVGFDGAAEGGTDGDVGVREAMRWLARSFDRLHAPSAKLSTSIETIMALRRALI